MKSAVLKRIFTLHSWLGLINGLWLGMLGLSGSLLVYYQELDRWLNRETLTVAPQAERLPVDSLFHLVRARYPAASGTAIMWFPQHPEDCYSFRLYGMAEEQSIYFSWDLYQTDVDPYSGKEVRAGYYRDFHSFLHWTLTFHYCLHLGTPGMLAVTLAGILLFLNSLTGLILYRRYLWKALIFRAPVVWRNWRTISSGLHRYVGVWSLALNLLIFYSGLQMNWTVFDRETWAAPQPQPPITQPYTSIDRLMGQVDEIFPGFRIEHVYIPFTARSGGQAGTRNIRISGHIPGTPSIVPHGSSSVHFLPHTGEVAETHDINQELRGMNLWEQFNAVAYSFHAGTFAGEYSRVLYVLLGLTPALLSFTGFLMWWRRWRHTRRGGASRRARRRARA
ncbi:MAG: PepSY-associated TM helix domain-containing protein [Bacteroidia bacterium]|nr:PepSY-associated TM helix domain-containing protein [Bacteroidia bacterium]